MRGGKTCTVTIVVFRFQILFSCVSGMGRGEIKPGR